MYKVVFTKNAQKDIHKLKSVGLTKKAKQLVELIKIDPYASPPSYEKLVGDLSGAYSRRINIKHRLVYSIDEEEKIVKIIRMWTHYE
jgi:Txe/YoeB family toxin of toxin-antitoxin system